MSILNIAGIQSPIIWEKKSANLEHFNQVLKTLNDDIDLVILPEMFQTGFTMDPTHLSETMVGDTIEWMKEKAKQYDCCISGSIIIEDGGEYYNRFLFVKANGEIQNYDKRHLFAYGGEKECFSPGKLNETIKIKDWNILPRICYDLRFPVWNRKAKQADLLIFTANWPSTRITHWDTLIKARAIENQVYTVGINRIGQDGNGLIYTGHSSAYRFDGQCITNLYDAETVMIVRLEKEEQKNYRTKFPFLQDADDYHLD
jgi:predicted amidohydrolase